MNTLTTILNTTCQFFMIIELADSKREQVVSAANLNEAESIAKDMQFRFYLIEPYELRLPIVDEGQSLSVCRELPHYLQVQAI